MPKTGILAKEMAVFFARISSTSLSGWEYRSIISLTVHGGGAFLVQLFGYEKSLQD